MTLRAAAVGVVAGFVWGVVARGFMRLMTVTPEFTWSGTLYIVGTATVVVGPAATETACGMARAVSSSGSAWPPAGT